jgi:phospholipid N-methyltransferase
MPGVVSRLSRWSETTRPTRSLKRGLRRTPGVLPLVRRFEDERRVRLGERRLRRLEREGDVDQRARLRWRTAPPDAGLTWGLELSGDTLVDAAQAHGALGPDRALLEVGPGYGRLIRSLLNRGVGFSHYTALDISEPNVRSLRRDFEGERIRIVHGDVTTVSLDSPVDSVLSFLTFKHIYPSFEGALANLQPQLSPGGMVMFDLIEGRHRYFEADGVTFIREYTRDEVEAILRRTSLERIAFDRLEHAPGHVRLLVVARKP